MRKEVIIVTLILFLIIPILYWLSNNNLNFSSTNDDIKGVSSVASEETGPGFGVTVTSSSTWDFVSYLCKNLDECIAGLEAGKKLGTISGGAAADHKIDMKYEPDWEDYGFIKYYVKSGWGSAQKGFKVAGLGDIPSSKIYTIKSGVENYAVIVAPLENLKFSYYKSAAFLED